MTDSFKSWEWMVVMKKGGYNMEKADDETRKKQLEDYKKRRRAELVKELRELEMLF